MTNKAFNAYVFEQRRQGRSDSQIARSLGMSLAHFIGKLNGVDVDKVDPPKKTINPVQQPQKAEVPKPVEKKHDMKPEPKKEAVPEAPKPAEEDNSWME